MKYLTQAQAATLIGITPSNLYRGEYLGEKIKPVIHNRKKVFLRTDCERLKSQREQIKAQREARQHGTRSGYMKYRDAMMEKQRCKTIRAFIKLYAIEQAADRWLVYLKNNIVADCPTEKDAEEYILLQRGKERAPRHLF